MEILRENIKCKEKELHQEKRSPCFTYYETQIIRTRRNSGGENTRGRRVWSNEANWSGCRRRVEELGRD